MAATPTQVESRSTSRVLLSATGTILLAIALGLCAGYLDLVVLVLLKFCWNDLRYYWCGSDFPWSIPVVSAFLLGVAGAIVAIINRVGPWKPISLRVGAWLFATLAIWSALLRVPLYGVCTLLLAAGLARPVSTAVVALNRRPRQLRYSLGALVGLLIVLAACSSGLRAVRSYRSLTNLPAPPKGALNVVLIVWDTVRAPSVSLYGYDRDNTPNLKRWAKKGARYVRAIAPAPWTYPSHSSMFTGMWPYQLNTQWNSYLDTTCPTLAEYLASRGYLTAGFAANTRCCSYETGLDRGFIHYEDYPLSPAFLLGRTYIGGWIRTNLLSLGDIYESKWITLQSRDASATNDAFLAWLKSRQQDRPFFAFLNYYDAHNPYVPPHKYSGRFGIQPRLPDDYLLLLDFRMDANDPNWDRNVTMARDRYDDCIAALDDQLGRLMSELLRQRLLDNTVVIITGDHGESFGDHNVFSHGTGLYVDQIAVPLVILSPGAPAGFSVTSPVSLRDLPATVVEQLGLSAGSPFPGHSLADFWTAGSGQKPPSITPALSELVGNSLTFKHDDKPSGRGVQMSLMAPGWHYIREGSGPEQIYDLSRDMGELNNMAGSAQGEKELVALRKTLLEVLADSPGSIDVENTYLKSFRQQLQSLVQANPPPNESTAAASGAP